MKHGKINDEMNKTEDLKTNLLCETENKINCANKCERNVKDIDEKIIIPNNKFCDKVIKFTQLDLPQKYSTIYGNFLKGFNLLNPYKISEITSQEMKSHKLKLFIHECGNLSKKGNNIPFIRSKDNILANELLSKLNPKNQIKIISQNSNKQSEWLHQKTRFKTDNLIKQKSTANCKRRFHSNDYTSNASHQKNIHFSTNHKKNTSDSLVNSQEYFNDYKNEKALKKEIENNFQATFYGNSYESHNPLYFF